MDKGIMNFDTSIKTLGVPRYFDVYEKPESLKFSNLLSRIWAVVAENFEKKLDNLEKKLKEKDYIESISKNINDAYSDQKTVIDKDLKPEEIKSAITSLKEYNFKDYCKITEKFSLSELENKKQKLENLKSLFKKVYKEIANNEVKNFFTEIYKKIEAEDERIKKDYGKYINIGKARLAFILVGVVGGSCYLLRNIRGNEGSGFYLDKKFGWKKLLVLPILILGQIIFYKKYKFEIK